MDAQGQTSSPPSSPPSSPLSVLSKSPSLPPSPTTTLDASKRYPSPTSSMPSGSQSPIKVESAPDSIHVNTDDVADDPPPRKKRRLQGPKERTTEYLDLKNVSVGLDGDDEAKLERLLSALKKRKKIVVIAGAGISVSAGIPDFRSKQGLFATLPNEHKMKGSGKHLFDASVYKHDSSTEKFHKMVCDLAQMVSTAKPTPFHHMLASLAEEGRLLRLYTQNVDCIDTNMAPLSTTVPLNTKGPWPTSIQLHGSIEKMVCTKCAHIDPFNSELFIGHEAPLCEKCKELDNVRTSYAGKRSHGIGRLRPRMVLYNEYNPDEEAIGNVSSTDLKSRPDAVIVVGTSLKIPGVRRLVKELCQVTRSRRDGFTAWINVDPEPQHNDFKECWDLVVRGQCDDVAGLISLPHWDEQDIEDSAILSGEDHEIRQRRLSRDKLEVQLPPALPSQAAPKVRKALPDTPRKSKLEVVLEAKPKLVEQVQGIPTPTASPKMPASEPGKKLAKSKQSKLSFAGKQVPDSESEASIKGKKSKPKKPRQTKKAAAPPKGTVTQTFKAVKSRTDDMQATEKKAMDSLASPDLSSQAGLSDAYELPPLRPRGQKAPDSVMYTSRDAHTSESLRSEEPPSTPTLPVLQKAADTITAALPPSTPPMADRSIFAGYMSGQSTPTIRARPNSSPCIGVSTDTYKGSIVAAVPSTPTHKRTLSADTISPKSIPRGMEMLVD